MTFEPIERRLRESAAEDPALLKRAATLLLALPEPAPLSNRAEARVLAHLRAGAGGLRNSRVSLRTGGFLAIFAFTVAASATRGWWQPAAPPKPVQAPPAAPDSAQATPSTPAQLKPAAQPLVMGQPSPPAEVQEPSISKAALPAKESEKPSAEIPRLPQVKPRLLTDLTSDPHRPRVPFEVARTGTQISVLLEICVAASGSVYDARILESVYPRLDEGILEHVRRFKYEPARSGDRPVPFCFPLKYRLNVDPKPHRKPEAPRL